MTSSDVNFVFILYFFVFMFGALYLCELIKLLKLIAEAKLEAKKHFELLKARGHNPSMHASMAELIWSFNNNDDYRGG